MTATAILAELHARGARAIPEGSVLHLEPADRLTPDLIERARRHKAEILRLLDAGLPIRPPAYPNARGDCIDCLAPLPGKVEIGLCSLCAAARHPKKREQAATPCQACGGSRWWRLELGRRWLCETCRPPMRQDVERIAVEVPAPAVPFRVIVDRLKPAERAVRLNAWTVILDPRAAIAADMASLHAAVARMNAGWAASYSDCYPAALDAEEILERLRACGCEARVTSVS
jgi:hypothetical protein